MASSRVFLVLALVAILLCGAFAQKTKSYGSKSAKFAAKKCLKAAGAGCATCENLDDDGAFECASCKTGYAYDDVEFTCTCSSEEGYGKLTKAQFMAWKKSGAYKVKSFGKKAKWGNCVECEAFGLVAEDDEDGNAVCVALE